MNHNYVKNIFVICSEESYGFVNDNMEHILYSYNFENCNIILPFEYNYRDFINMNIDYNSRNFLIESDEYIKNLDNFYSLSNEQIQDLRIIESKHRSYKHWLNQKLDYSKKKIPTVDTCLVIRKENLNHNIEKELRDELNIAKQLKKVIINIEQEKMETLNEKIMILKQKYQK
ncbi:MAG: hypothetical protein PHX03_00595 [Bacilli bacterium]|nr:hypothetical protein [Bacilli bacterium]